VLPLVRTRRADEDLIEIWRYIAQDDPAAADRVTQAIERRWLQLADHPLSGVLRPDIGQYGRHLVAGSYVMLYRVHEDHVEILRILHGRRNITRRSLTR
jgi:toxin ParE1/3/4